MDGLHGQGALTAIGCMRSLIQVAWQVFNKKVDGGNGGVTAAVPMSPIRAKGKSKVSKLAE